jgi:hypothetical protein
MRAFATSLLALAACGAAPGPAWPKSAGLERMGEAAEDGGESLAPRVPSEIAAVEAGGAPEPVSAKPDARAAVGPPLATDTPTAAPAGDPIPQVIEL